MITSTLYEELITTISPEKIAMYLSYQRWRKEEEIEGIISFWSKIIDGEKLLLLLPLDKAFADFEDKIEDLISTLSKAESRPIEEILKVLGNTSIIAKENGREIIDIKVELEDRNKHDISARNVGLVLKSLEDFFASLGKHKGKNLKKQFEKRAAQSAVELSLIETFHGSFGLRMGLGKCQQLNLLEPTIAEKIAEDFINLIKASNQDSSEALRIEIEKYRGEPSIKFKYVIQYFKDLESDLFLEWGSVNPNKGGIAKLSFYKILQAFEVLRKFELEQENSFEVIGRLILAGVGNDKNNRLFLLRDEADNINYKGHISKNLVTSFDDNIELDKIYKATIMEELNVNPTTGQEVKLYTLIRLEKINN